MMIREWYLRKKFWITDFLNGGRMWKEYRDVLHIAGNHYLTNSGGGGETCRKNPQLRNRKCSLL